MQPNISLSLLANIVGLTKEVYKNNQLFEHSANMSALELEIGKIWQQLLKYELFDKDDDLFKVGGDSIAAIQIMSSVNKEFGVEIPMEELFSHDHFSISWLAELVEKYKIKAIGELEYSALLAHIESLSEEEVESFLLAEMKTN